ncbi:unnamed protein product, partial [Vitis vinifera]|uniref:Uncharacterized protein n=1 Tax=Vitis vinifera TaxID=29760 RepID=D7SNM6_VITVI|eukprot:XP_019075518.1 PREDICTED: uncharacterized protein LOC104877391 isoform X2 [Vitis vinifera]
MPLCRSKVEQVTTEDLVELSEIEKHMLGQTRCLGSISDVDNSPQSLLSFSGNKDVHALYDFMLNYRSFLTSLTSVDVPLLCSPVPFQNAALSAPEVNCRELKRADHVAFPLKGSKMKDEANESVRTVLQQARKPTPKQQQESTYAFGIPEAVVACYMHSAFLKGLKYANASFTARLSPV